LIGFLSVSIYAFLFLTPFQANYEKKATISKTISHGDLSSGMKYKFLNHKKEKGSVSVLVAVDVGSVDEEEHERGIAHMVEHLAFDSTEDFPGRATVWHEGLFSFQNTFGSLLLCIFF
jgi:zinc protease